MKKLLFNNNKLAHLNLKKTKSILKGKNGMEEFEEYTYSLIVSDKNGNKWSLDNRFTNGNFLENYYHN
jgi:hypothetical protein